MISKSSRNQLNNSIRRTFSVLLQNCSDLVICLDTDLCIIECNNTAIKAHHWKRHEILKKNYMELCLRDGFNNPIFIDPNKIFLGKKITNHACTFIHKDKTEHTVIWNITRLLNDKKEPYGLLMVGHDITDIKEAWAQVYHLDSIIKNAPGLIYYWKDRNSVHLGCNNSFAQLAGLKSCEEVVGKTDFDLPWKSQADSYRKDDQQVIESGKPKSNIEDLLIAADGTTRIVVANKVPLRDIEGNIVGTLSTAADITQLKEAEQATLEAKNKAEIANQAKANFLATMSHELRTPLNAIMGMAQILLCQNPTQEQQECIDIIQNASLNLLSLINDILDFTRLEAGKLEISADRFDFYELTHAVISSFQHQLDHKPIKLLLDYSSDTPHYIALDSRRVRQVLINLINNAIKFTLKGEINVSVTCLEQTKKDAIIRITITDTGIGIPNDKLEQIFERFTQVESQYSRRFEGAGLGLSISKQLTEAMGGSIGVSSTLGEGSSFWVEFPIKMSTSIVKQDTPAPSDSDKLNSSAIKNPQILLIEDNLLNQMVAKSLLQQLNCRIDIASDGKQALQLFADKDYDLIFSDIGLPDMDGLTVIREMRKHEQEKATTPIIALTAHVLKEDRENCFNAGTDAVITKPIMPEELKMTLKQWLGKKSIKKANLTLD